MPGLSQHRASLSESTGSIPPSGAGLEGGIEVAPGGIFGRTLMILTIPGILLSPRSEAGHEAGAAQAAYRPELTKPPVTLEADWGST